MATEMFNTASRSITRKTGSEGPRHDPYSFEEYTVSRADQPDVVLHMGLGVWLKVGNVMLREDHAHPGLLEHTFETFLGCSLKSFERAMGRVHSIKCGARAAGQTSGFPGEYFTVCENGHTMHYHFCESEVI